jgi:hypothetical protein
MQNQIKALIIAALISVSGQAFAGPVNSMRIMTSPHTVTEVLLPPGVGINNCVYNHKLYRVSPVVSGQGSLAQRGFAVTPKSQAVKSNIIINANDGNTYVIWLNNSRNTPSKMVYRFAGQTLQSTTMDAMASMASSHTLCRGNPAKSICAGMEHGLMAQQSSDNASAPAGLRP